jgi:glutathione S-transferase
MSDKRVLYDLAAAEADRRFSPYCWRTKMALAHKGLPVETIPWRFTEKDVIAPSGQPLVPVLVDNGRWIADSWAIANYLEDTYSQAPSLFGGATGRSLTRYYSTAADAIAPPMAGLLVLDIYERIHDKDRAYFRESREKRFGMTLEAAASDREQRLPAFRDSLAPLRAVLQTQPFFGGQSPLYADYAFFGPFQWARCISPFRILDAADPLSAWLERLLERFDGMAGKAPAYY